MAFRKTHFDRCHDVTRIIWGYLPLRDFQAIFEYEEKQSPGNHICAYADRYHFRYGKPLMAEKLFEDEESQYLFMAGYEHDEVGYRSHLYLPPLRCFRGAAVQDDAVLYKYFIDRLPLDCSSSTTELFQIAAANGNAEIIRLTPVSDSPWDREDPEISRIRTIEAAKALEEHPCACSASFTLARDFPVADVLALLVIPGQRPDKRPATLAHMIAGFVASGDPAKTKLAHKFLADWASHCHEETKKKKRSLLLLGLAAAYVDEPRYVRTLWPKLKDDDFSVRELFQNLALCGAVDSLKWLIDAGAAALAGRVTVRSVWSSLLRRDKLPQVIELLERAVQPPLLSGLLDWLYATAGDARVLRVRDRWEVDRIANELLKNGHLDLLSEFCLEVLPADAEGKPISGPLASFILDRDLPLPVSLDWRTVSRFSYARWKEFVKLIQEDERLTKQWVPFAYAPTPAIHEALPRTDHKVWMPPFVIFNRHSKDVLFEQIANGNVEYVTHYFQKLAKSHPIRHYTGYPRSEAMRTLLTKHNVRYDNPKEKKKKK